MSQMSVDQRTDAQVVADMEAFAAANADDDRVQDMVEPATPAGDTGSREQPPKPQGKAAARRGARDNSSKDAAGEDAAGEDKGSDCDSDGVGGGLLKRGRDLLGAQSQSQGSIYEDDGDAEEEDASNELRKKYKSAVWMHKANLEQEKTLKKLIDQHGESKKELVAPIKHMMKGGDASKERKEALTYLSGLLSEACDDGALRDLVIEAASVLEEQVKMITKMQATYPL